MVFASADLVVCGSEIKVLYVPFHPLDDASIPPGETPPGENSQYFIRS